MTPITKEQAVQLAEASGLLNCEFDNFDDCILALVQASYKLGRNAWLDAAKDKVRIHTLGQPLALAEKLTSVIESLKDNTP